MSAAGPTSRSDLSFLLLTIGIILISGALSLFLGQDLNFDLQNYHFYNGFAFLSSRLDTDIAPAGLQTYFNPFVDVFHYLGMTSLPPRFFGFVLGAVHGLSFPLLACLAYQVFRRSMGRAEARFSAVICGLIGLIGPDAVALLGTTFKDNLLAIPVIGALFLLVKSTATGESVFAGRFPLSRMFWVSLLAGGTAGLKLTMLTYCVGFAWVLLPLAYWEWKRGDWSRPALLLGTFGLGSLAGFFLTDGYWAFLIARKFGNPIFPLANSVFHSRYAAFSSFHDTRWLADGFLGYLKPFLYFANGRSFHFQEVSMRDFRCLLLFVGGVAVLMRTGYRRLRRAQAPVPWHREEFVVVGFWIAAYAVWAKTFYYYRYFAALEVLAPIPLFIFLRQFVGGRKLKLAGLAILILLLATTRHGNWGRGRWERDWSGTMLPTTSLAPNSLVILVSRPISFVIPYFPADTRFVHISSMDEANVTGDYELMIVAAISAHKGPFFIFVGEEKDAQLAAKYGLVPNGRCTPVPIRIQTTFQLCELIRR